jgi:hypothetical protein
VVVVHHSLPTNKEAQAVLVVVLDILALVKLEQPNHNNPAILELMDLETTVAKELALAAELKVLAVVVLVQRELVSTK